MPKDEAVAVDQIVNIIQGLMRLKGSGPKECMLFSIEMNGKSWAD